MLKNSIKNQNWKFIISIDLMKCENEDDWKIQMANDTPTMCVGLDGGRIVLII